MSGTKAGGQKAAATNKKKYGADFYHKIGGVGGTNGNGYDYTGGFASDATDTRGMTGSERASVFGRIGGLKSKRGKKVRDESI